MNSPRNQRAVENRLREALKVDRARVQIGKISRFGLLEMSRQRLRPSLAEFSHIVCPRCNGNGAIRSVESLSLSVLRLIEEEAMKESTTKVVVQLPVDAATFLLNEKRGDVRRVEERHDVSVVLVPNPNLETPHYELQRMREQDSQSDDQTSYRMVAAAEQAEAPHTGSTAAKPPAEEPAVKNVLRQTTPEAVPAEVASLREQARPGLLKRILAGLFGTTDTVPAPPAEPRPAPAGNRGSGTAEKTTGAAARGRSERGQSRGRDRGDRSERGGRRRQSGQQQRTAEQSQPRDARPEPQAPTPAEETSPAEDGETRSSSRRHRRGGRGMGRRRRRENEQRNEQEDTVAGESTRGNSHHETETSPGSVAGNGAPAAAERSHAQGEARETRHDVASPSPAESSAEARPPQAPAQGEMPRQESSRDAAERDIGSEDPTISRFERRPEPPHVGSEDPTVSRFSNDKEDTADHSEDPTITRHS
jgi:ribonuclease E